MDKRESAALPLRIALLAYPGCLGTELLGLADVLRLAGDWAQALAQQTPPRQPPALALELVSLQGPGVTLAGGFELGTRRPRGRYDWVVVPGLGLGKPQELATRLQALAPESAFIAKSFARGSTVASVCLGSFLLGQAGLLSRRRCTTSWLFAAELAARHPEARVQADAVLVQDGGLLTSGAVSSVFDLALHLVKQVYGARVASAIARVTLLPPPRASQAPYADETLQAAVLHRLPALPPEPPFMQAVKAWLADRLAEGFDLNALAAAFHVSPRTLLRRVRQETGHTPLALMQQARVQKAKQLLQSTRWSTAQVVQAVGYQDVPTFTRLFQRWVGESPARFRRRSHELGQHTGVN